MPSLLAWFGAGLVSGPLAVVLHESGHWLGGRLADIPDMALHYASVSHPAAGILIWVEVLGPRWMPL